MTSKLTRRDFLKLGGMMPLSLAARPLLGARPAWNPVSGERRNILIVIFDALSALNLSMQGYGRNTMPNLERLAKRAIVYHNNYAGSNFTTSGTATLLTGTLPWTHRAIEDNGRIADPLVSHNLFRLFDDYFGIAFTHNSWVMGLLDQLRGWIDELVPREKLYLQTFDAPIHQAFYRDDDVADVAWARAMKLQGGFSYSLLLSRFYTRVHDAGIANLESGFPRGVPMNASKDAFLLEQSTEWLANRLKILPQPFLGYFHFLPPHAPYRTSQAFFDRFAGDGLRLVAKPLSEYGTAEAVAAAFQARTEYDEFILYADQAFADFYASLERSGLLDNTWLILTSDHGEMFERGHIGHGNPTLYDPVVRVPLVIFEPGRESGLQVHSPTSAVDLLATLAYVAGRPVPEWAEGTVLPPFATTPLDAERSILAVQARKSQQKSPLSRATIAMRKGAFKIMHYAGYPDFGPEGLTRLFDLEADPAELTDLAAVRPETTTELLAELKARLRKSDEPYVI